MTNNNILIGHLGWDGAHFLCCCLSMSDSVYFNNFTLRGKIEFYFKNMSTVHTVNEKPVWNDVFMFFGSSYQTKNYIHYRQTLSNDVNNNFEQFSVDSGLQEKTLISRLHVPIYYKLGEMLEKNISHPAMNMFNCKHFICLTNTRLFSSLRGIKIDYDPRIKDSDGWDKGFAPIPDIKWFDGPLTEIDLITNSTTVSGFNSLSKEVQETIKSYSSSNVDDLFNLTELYKDDNELLKKMITYEWDCNWFLTEEDTLKHIKDLYSIINLGKCNEKLISEMYRIWINKMDYLKKWYIEEDSGSEHIPSTEQDCPNGCWPSERWNEYG